MAEYEIRISGVHYGANGDSVAGQKDTEEMHMRTRELLSWIDRVRPIVTLSPDPENRVHRRAMQSPPQQNTEKMARIISRFDSQSECCEVLSRSALPLRASKNFLLLRYL